MNLITELNKNARKVWFYRLGSLLKYKLPTNLEVNNMGAMFDSIVMKCGHHPDCIMSDVPYHDEKIEVAACSTCFDQLGTAIQPACNQADIKPIMTEENDESLIGTAIVTALVCIALLASFIVSI